MSLVFRADIGRIIKLKVGADPCPMHTRVTSGPRIVHRLACSVGAAPFRHDRRGANPAGAGPWWASLGRDCGGSLSWFLRRAFRWSPEPNGPRGVIDVSPVAGIRLAVGRFRIQKWSADERIRTADPLFTKSRAVCRRPAGAPAVCARGGRRSAATTIPCPGSSCASRRA
jgi:hypothetical protein